LSDMQLSVARYLMREVIRGHQRLSEVTIGGHLR
jgi:hypothetical protein